MKITLLSLVLCLLCSLNMAAQGSDIGSNPEDTTIHQLSKKELRRRKVAKRNIHYNILGGPSYTPDFGALIGGSALVTFRMNPSDTLQKRSVLPMAVAVMFEGGLNLMVKPQLFFKNDKFRIFGKFTYKNTLENFMVSAMLPISIMSAVTLPVNIVIAVSRLIRGFYSVWVKVISLPVPRLT